LILAAVIVLAIWILPAIPVGLLGALIIVVFGFFFATVSSRMVGLVGSSNNPVSGMAIATLIIATALLKGTGHTGVAGMTSAICIGTIICIIAAMAGDISQGLKTGYIVGATPKNQQLGELIGAVVSAFAIGGIMYLLDAAWGFGSKELPAPQATLMKLVVEGVMGGSLPWTLVLTGAGIAIAVEVIGIPVLPVAIGLYLPIHLSAPIFAGGLLRAFFDRKGEEGAKITEKGILYGSSMIAGEGLIGILLALFAVIPLANGKSLLDTINLGGKLGNFGGLAFFILLLASFVLFTTKKNKK
jgi:putative OPT family oligopeptide transporter